MAKAHLRRYGTGFLIALAMSAGAAFAQSHWPTIWEVRTQGRPISPAELADLVVGKTVIFDIGGYADGSGYVLNCDPDGPVAIWYDNGSSVREEDTRARLDGSRLCIIENGRQSCLNVTMMPGWTTPFIQLPLHADRPGADPLSEDDLAFLKGTAATRLATLPISATALVDLAGEIDLGVVTYTLPEGLDLTLRGANDFPVMLSIGESHLSGFRVLVEIIGWPGAFRTPGEARAPSPDDEALALADLDLYRPALAAGEPSVPGEYGERYVSTDDRVAEMTLPGGLCLRVEERVSVLSDPEGIQIKPGATLYARQYCVAPTAGALFAVTVALSDAADDAQVAAFWDRARGVLDSIRIGSPEARGR